VPQRKAGIKDLRKNYKNRMHNLDIKTELKKTVKQFRASILDKNKSEAETCLKLVYKKIDKATKRNILEKNTAARRKSQYSKQLASIA